MLTVILLTKPLPTTLFEPKIQMQKKWLDIKHYMITTVGLRYTIHTKLCEETLSYTKLHYITIH